MKTQLLTLLTAVTLLSCNQDQPIACFTYGSKSIKDDAFPKVGEKLSFESCSENATSYFWDFGDGNTSTDESPSHTYDKSGFYEVCFTAEDKSVQSISISYVSIVSMDGEWTGYLELNGTILPMEIELEQDDDELEGEFLFADRSGSSDIKRGEVDIEDVSFRVDIYYDDGEKININFEGKVDGTYTSMSGDCEVKNSGGTIDGSWNLVKIDD